VSAEDVRAGYETILPGFIYSFFKLATSESHYFKLPCPKHPQAEETSYRDWAKHERRNEKDVMSLAVWGCPVGNRA
jgi:hypothetical protein